MEATLTARLADYRILRRDIERNVLPLATSIDGRTFEFQAPLEPLDPFRRRVGDPPLTADPGGEAGGVPGSPEEVHVPATPWSRTKPRTFPPFGMFSFLRLEKRG